MYRLRLISLGDVGVPVARLPLRQLGLLVLNQILQRRGRMLESCSLTYCGDPSITEEHLSSLCSVSHMPRLRAVAGPQKQILDAVYRRQRQLEGKLVSFTDAKHGHIGCLLYTSPSPRD